MGADRRTNGHTPTLIDVQCQPMISGFDILYALASIGVVPVLGWRMLRGKYRTGWAGRLGFAKVMPKDRPTLLIHAVSVGEINLIRRLVDTLYERTAGGLRIVIATTTDTGLARARQLYEPRHEVVRYPLDPSFCVRRFLKAVRPDAVALVELEIWPNFTRLCQQRGIPLAVINGRLSARSFRGYRRFAWLLTPMFRRLSVAAVQTDTYAGRFAGMGVAPDKIRVFDTMKWDAAELADPATFPGSAQLARAMGIDPKRPLIVAGSTGPGEERMLIDTCPPDAQLLLVPRKPERFEEVAALAPGIVRRTRHTDATARGLDDKRLFLLDTMGELRKAYALANVCIVGRSFLGLHGSDSIESIALGKPTIIGPHHGDFQETVDAFRAGEGIEVSENPGESAAKLLANPDQAAALAQRGQRVIHARQGSTQRHADMLLSLLKWSDASKN